MQIIILLIVAVIILFTAGLVIVGAMRSKGTIHRALNLALFSITMPRESNPPAGGQRPEKEIIAVMEQLYASLTSIHSKGWNKFIYGEPYIAFEMAVSNIGENIHFYAAAPRGYKDTFEKQIHGFFPNAEIESVEDYNIFHAHGASAGAVIRQTQSSMLPIRTYQKLESDPLNELATALSKLEKAGEGAAIQVLIRPAHQSGVTSHAQKVVREMQQGKPFKEAIYTAGQKSTEGGSASGGNQQPKTVSVFEEEIMKSIQQKVSKPLFDVNIRVVASAADETRAQQILNQVSGSFVQFNDSSMNAFSVSTLKSRALQKLLFKFSFRVFDTGSQILLSSEEVTSIFHFPLPHTSAAKIKFLKSKPAEPPANLPSEGIVLGRNIFRGAETLIHMSDADRQRHTYIIGQTGTGKSTLMKAMLRQDIENGKGLCLIDPHGEFAEFALSVVPENRWEDVVYFDPGDISKPMGLNMLEIDPKHPEQKTMVIDELFGIFDKLYDLKTTGGPMFERYFKNSALLLLDDYEHDIPTLADISRVLVDEQYRADKLSRETNPLVKEFWIKEAEQAGGEAALKNMAPYISSKVTAFVYNEFLRPIINQQHSAFNFREVMDSGKILIVNLSKGRIGDLNANLLGMVIVGKLLMAALSRVDMDEKSRKDFYLYIDEFQNFTTDSISTILSEARKYRLDLIIAHQFIRQLKENIRDAVFGNVGSIVAFRIGPDDAEFMKNKFEPVFSPQDLMNIDNLNCYVNLLINGQTARPFNIKIETERVFNAGYPDVARYLKELSQYKFGRPREEVEAEISARFNPKPK